MANFKVQSDQLVSSAGNLSQGAEHIESELASMRSRIAALAGSWEGSGSVAFADLYAKFNKAAADVNESLVGISALLNKTGGFYAETEAKVTSAISSAS